MRKPKNVKGTLSIIVIALCTLILILLLTLNLMAVRDNTEELKRSATARDQAIDEIKTFVTREIDDLQKDHDRQDVQDICRTKMLIAILNGERGQVDPNTCILTRETFDPTIPPSPSNPPTNPVETNPQNTQRPTTPPPPAPSEPSLLLPPGQGLIRDSVPLLGGL